MFYARLKLIEKSSRGDFMAQLYVITVDNLKRTPVSTRKVVEKYQACNKYKSVGVDGRLFAVEELDRQNRMDLLAFILGGEPSVGEIGCLLSHQLIYEDIVLNHTSSALILEDDAEVLIDYTQLEQVLSVCENSGFDIITFYSPKGSVGLDLGESVFRVLVPGIFAIAYWVSKNGAEKLLAKKYLLGLADWPINIANLKFGCYRGKIIANSGTENSFIYPTLEKNSHERVNIAFRPLRNLLNKEALEKSKLIANEVGLLTIFKYVLFYRIIRRLARVITRNKKGLNNSIILKVRNYGLA